MVTMETFFGKAEFTYKHKNQSSNEQNYFFFSLDISIYFLKSFSNNCFYKILREKIIHKYYYSNLYPNW